MKVNLTRFGFSSILFCVFLLSCKTTPEIQLNLDNLENSSDSVRHFTINNPGSANLKIIDYTTSCECTVINLIKGSEINANDSLIVKVQLNKKLQDADNMIFITIKTNAKPQLTSFHFRP